VKIGIISDIHSNLEALDVVMKRLAAEEVERIYCLGDIVGYGPNPNECVEKVRSSCFACVLGNHDAALTGLTPIYSFNSYARSAIEWTKRVITEENLEYLKSLPLAFMEEQFMLVHATPVNPASWDYIHSDEEAQGHFLAMNDTKTAFIGHSHVPKCYETKDKSKRIINVGSVGQPRDRDPRASCGLFDSKTGKFEWIRETYSVQDTAQKIRTANLPEYLAVRLFIGM
jgi:putative phosphoesterase